MLWAATWVCCSPRSREFRGDTFPFLPFPLHIYIVTAWQLVHMGKYWTFMQKTFIVIPCCSLFTAHKKNSRHVCQPIFQQCPTFLVCSLLTLWQVHNATQQATLFSIVLQSPSKSALLTDIHKIIAGRLDLCAGLCEKVGARLWENFSTATVSPGRPCQCCAWRRSVITFNLADGQDTVLICVFQVTHQYPCRS